jgi:hypothetical protein
MSFQIFLTALLLGPPIWLFAWTYGDEYPENVMVMIVLVLWVMICTALISGVWSIWTML